MSKESRERREAQRGKGKYFWNWKPVKIEHVLVVVKEVKEHPLYWHNYECLTNNNPNGHHEFHAIEITTENGIKFIISNEYGIGINKCRKGGTFYQYHAGFKEENIVKIKRTGDPLPGGRGELKVPKKYNLNEEGYVEQETARAKWQMENYPEEYEKLRQAREANTAKTTKNARINQVK